MREKVFGLIIFIILILTGCTNFQTLMLPSRVENTIEKVSKVYGEENPTIAKVHADRAEVTNERIYMVFLEGDFHKGEQKSEKLSFSVTKDGKKAWAIMADGWQENEVNIPN